MCDTIIEEAKELLEGSVIHPVDESHFNDTEVEYGTSGGYWSEVLSPIINLNGLLFGFSELLIHLLGFGLDLVKYINELYVLKKGTLSVGKLIQQEILVVLQGLGVECYFFLQLLKSVFQRLLFHTNQSSKQLLLKTTLGYCEIDDCRLCCQLW